MERRYYPKKKKKKQFSQNKSVQDESFSKPSTSQSNNGTCTNKRFKSTDLGNDVQIQTSGTSSKGRKKRTKRKRGRNKEINPESTSDASSSDISSGFHYDPIKRRYFKIMDNASISSAVTRESLAREVAEKKRLENLKELHDTRTFDHSIPDLTNLLFKSRQGDIGFSDFRQTLLKSHVNNLKLIKTLPFFEEPIHGHEKVEHMIKMISSPNHDKMLCLWSMKDTIMQRLQLVQLFERQRDDENQNLSVKLEPRGTTVLQSWSKITNVCWAPFPNYPERKNILYTTNCHSTGQALAFIRNLDASSPREVAFFDFSIGNQATWTCAWNSNTEKFSVGAEKTCLLIDVETRRLWELNTLNSDPYSQAFSSGHLLYNGTKKGQIVAHDLRSLSIRPIRCLNHKSSISHLLLSNDDRYLYASDFTGQIRVWDIRKNSVLMQYHGLYNEYKRIPFYIDDSNSILYGAGQDGYSRLWCLKTGKLLLNLPPPCSTTWDTIPSLQWSTCWGNRSGNSGLLMGLGDKLYVYSS